MLRTGDLVMWAWKFMFWEGVEGGLVFLWKVTNILHPIYFIYLSSLV
jgi:hypothetical protein